MIEKTNRKNILVLTSSFPKSKKDHGSQFVYELSQRLSVYHNITILCPHTKNTEKKEFFNKIKVIRFQYAPEILENIAYNDGIIDNLKKNRWLYLLLPFFFISQTLIVYKLIKDNKVDIIHVHWIIPQGIPILLNWRFIKKKSVKIITTSHGSDLYAFNNLFGTYLKKQILNISSALTVVSGSMKKFVEKNYKLKKPVTVIPMGTNFNTLFKPSSKEKDKNKLLFVGRLIEIKGVDYLIESLKYITNEFPDIQLTIIGNGSEKSKLSRIVEKNELEKHIHFVAHLDQKQLLKYYQTSTIAVFPFIKDNKSQQEEGFGLVVVEAMGCGCPVIVGNVSSMKDIVVNNKNGIITDVKEPEELARTIITLLKSPELQKKFSLNSRRHVIKHFSWEQTSNNFLSLINEI